VDVPYVVGGSGRRRCEGSKEESRGELHVVDCLCWSLVLML
jgi:hypothetical protein